MRRIALVLAALVLAAGLAAAPRHLQSRTTAGEDFVHFESAHVHPIALTPDGTRLLVVNTPDNRLSVFSLTGAEPQRIAEIPVGLEPVSVAALNDSIAWVVNELSDNVSVVHLGLGHVVNTLPVGDEPADVVFANGKAYVSVRTEDAIRVYDPATQGLLATIASPGREPRALVRNAAGTRVFVGHLFAGNRTTILAAEKIPPDSMPVDWDFPPEPFLPPAPRQGLIVQQVLGNWYDMYGTLWNSKLKHTMPDADVTEINTGTDGVVRSFSGAGTSIFGLAVNPADGKVFASVTESRNTLRFELRVSGYLVETNLAVLNPATGTTSLRKLDPHIDYETLPGTQAEADSAIGTPTGLAFDAAGTRAYVTSLATDKLGVLNPNGGSLSSVLARVPVVGGPTGVVVDDARGRIYVVGRYRNQLQTLRADSLTSVAVTAIGMDPTPDEIVNGRRVFYGGFTSAHGDQSCASCHVFGDTDGLAWDLGDPFGPFVNPPTPNPDSLAGFHPMKGPLMTQTLRGMTGTEPFHWRGDRANLAAFNPAFTTLMGRLSPLPDSQMTAFSDFTLAMRFGPNPNQNLDRTFPDAPLGQGSALRGRALFLVEPLFRGTRACNDCHDETNHGPGTNRQMVHRDTIAEFQDLKVPQMRNMYRKVGYANGAGAASKRGFGYSHDGSVTSVAAFLKRPQFTFDPDTNVANQQRMDLEAYMLAFDTGLAPAVGRQLTLTGSNGGEPGVVTTISTLRARAEAGDCDLVAKGRVAGQPRGWLYAGGGLWTADKYNEAPLTTSQLLALAGPGSEVTLTGVPPGSGQRIGVDRDRDTYLDGDELDGGSDPGDPASHPAPLAVGPRGDDGPRFALRAVSPNPFRDACDVRFTLARPGRVDVRVYDLMGREVRSIARGLWQEAGPASLRWDGRDADGRAAPAGVYFVNVQSGAERASRAVVRIR